MSRADVERVGSAVDEEGDERAVGQDELRDLDVTCGDDLAYTHSLNHLTGKRTDGETTDVWFRATVCLRKIDGEWMVAHEHTSVPFYMDGSYRIPRQPVKPGDRMPKDAAITEGWPVKSMITHPAPNAVFKVGRSILVEGRAWVGEGSVEKVELSFNEGISWQRATINSGGDKYAWRVFSYEYSPKTEGYVTVLARATDDRGDVGAMADELRSGFETGALRTLPIETIPFENAVEAYQKIADGRGGAKLVLTFL